MALRERLDSIGSDGTSIPWVVAAIGGSLVAATVAAAALEGIVGIADASPVYLLAVVLAAGLFGTWPAALTSVLAFLAYDFLFTTPRFTFAVTNPSEWLSLLLFLLIAVVIGRLTALLRERAEMADRRVRESTSLVAISRAIAMAGSFEEAAGEVAERLRIDAEMATVQVVLGDGERFDAPAASAPWRLLRSERDGTSDWVRISEGRDRGDDESGAPAADPGAVVSEQPGSTAGLPGDGAETYVVDIEAGEAVVGWIEATRVAGDPRPGRGARRILVLAADQLGIALRRDELSAELTAAEVARQSDALRAAILDSVSHDLRTPIATIRALAGGLLDPALPVDEEKARSAGAAIDEQAERLSGLVRGLLDMSRIQAGALHPDLAPYDLPELLDTALRRLLDPNGRGRIEVTLPRDLPPVHVDAVLFDVAVGNVLDNAVRHTPAGAPIRVAAAAATGDGRRVELTIEDGGPGVPSDALPHLFDRFYRVPADAEPARHGLGMGLAIARGFLEAMDATIEATPSALGGLAIRIGLPADPITGGDEAPG